jgi:NADH-quinone oxidoreductase subunit G
LLLRAAGRDAGLFYLLPGPNAFGAALMSAGSEAPGLLEAMEAGAIQALMLVEHDPFWHFPDRERLTRALEKLEFLLVLDYLPSPAAKRAHVFLPTLTVFEKTGSGFVNQEGRLQWAPPVHFGGLPLAQISPEKHPPRTFLNYVPGGAPRTPGEILAELAQALGAERPSPGPALWDWLTRNQNPVFARAGEASERPIGVRLLPPGTPDTDFGREAASGPGAEAPPGTLELLLVEATFGTEELASYSPYIQPVEETPRLTLHFRDAERLGLASGDRVALSLPGGSLNLKLRVAGNLAPGVLVLPRHRRLDWRKLATWPAAVPESAIRKAEE